MNALSPTAPRLQTRKLNLGAGHQCHRITIEMPTPLADQLNITAAVNGVTSRYLILSALNKAGYPVPRSDLTGDRRRKVKQS